MSFSMLRSLLFAGLSLLVATPLYAADSVAAVDKSAEKAVEKPLDRQVESPAKKTADKAADQPAEKESVEIAGPPPRADDLYPL